MTEHALLSASGAHKWLHCTPAPRLEETLPENTSDYAEEGRLAHAIGELKLRKYFIEPMSARSFNGHLKKLQKKSHYAEEMLRHTDTYLEYISGIAHSCASTPYVAVEKKLDYSAYAPKGFGTGDCILIHSDTLHVFDFKYGKGVPVTAEDNPQMKLYALGAYSAYAFLYPLQKVILHIIQPRVNSEPSSWELSVADLLAWGEEIKPIAERAFKGEGDFVPGEHCRFCRARAICRARADDNLALGEYKMMRPPLISNEEVGTILEKARYLASWVKHLEAFALKEALAGRTIPGWKAVAGRGSRQYSNVDKAIEALVADGYTKEILYEPANPLSVAKLEELIGKETYQKVLVEQGLINVAPGKPTLVPESDKRAPFQVKTTAAEDFSAPVATEQPPVAVTPPPIQTESILEQHKRFTAKL